MGKTSDLSGEVTLLRSIMQGNMETRIDI